MSDESKIKFSLNNSTSIPGNCIDKYHNIKCCEETLGIDNLLSQYETDREEIIFLVVNDPDKLIRTIWKMGGPLAIDNECLCKMGNGKIRTLFACAQCKNLRRIMDFRQSTSNNPFKIKHGKQTGSSLIINKFPMINPFLMWDDVSQVRAKLYVNKYQNLLTCGTPDISNMRCITGDNFTVKTIIIWMITTIFHDRGLPHFPMLYTSFICKNFGYTLYDNPTIGFIDELHYIYPLNYHHILSIISQLLISISELSTINFSHGSPSLNSLAFTKKPVSYSYDGMNIIAPFTLQIINLWNASATFNNIHFFPKNIKSSMYLERHMFVPEIATKSIVATVGTTVVVKSKPVMVYRLTNSSMEIQAAMRHIGFPLHIGSFDFYCFMVSLMCYKDFYDVVVSNHKLYGLWSALWLQSDIERVERLIIETHSYKKINDQVPVDIIRGAWLQCDIVPHMWSLVKTL
jgi:hypothetical protein